MSIFNEIWADRPFVLYVIAFVLSVLSLVLSNAWLLIPAVASGMVANYLCHKEEQNAENSKK